MARLLPVFGKSAVGEKKLASEPDLATIFEEIVQSQIAGSPMNEKVRWTNLKDSELVRLYESRGLSVSRFMVKQLTALKGFVKRKMKKTKTVKEVENRDQQFQKIKEKKEDFLGRGLPVLSIDTKKKEFIGQFYRAGKSYCSEAVEVYDHSWTSLANGQIVPHGIYDLKENKGYLSLGKSKERVGVFM